PDSGARRGRRTGSGRRRRSRLGLSCRLLLLLLPERWSGLFFSEKISKLVFAKPRRARNQIDPRELGRLSSLSGVEQNVGAVRAPRNCVVATVRHKSNLACFAAGN